MRSQSIGSTSIAAALTVTLISGFFFAPTTPASAAETLEPPLIIEDPVTAAQAGYPSATEIAQRERERHEHPEKPDDGKNHNGKKHSDIPNAIHRLKGLIFPDRLFHRDLSKFDPLHIVYLPPRAGKELIPKPVKVARQSISRAHITLTLGPHTSAPIIRSRDAQVVGKPLVGVGAANSASRDAGIWSSDLGITWSTGDGRTLIAFGDNYGPGHFGPFSRFRGSALAWADTRNPYNVRTTKFFTGFENKAEEIVDCGHGKHNELSKIPTAALSINGVQYIDFMSVRSWGNPGQWVTNFSHIYKSYDYGTTWLPTSIHRTNKDGFKNFQMGAFVKYGKYVYEFGTPSGRMGDGYISRVRIEDFEDLDSWEYWDGEDWVQGDPSAAYPVIPGRASEMSVQWNPRIKRFMLLTLGSGDNIYLRYSKDLINWTNRYTLIPSQGGKTL